eukprot:TRINITY_DN11337_c0_g1_i1.p1 TRINITY_DN11337_c0_g1~~TRINITY_DN11337_c0_g1_i1.p1  ORF type:complete len:378 (-),score=90.66 TRINITY_DN11337_c0_g1_i1:39-1118(-)
MTCLILGISGSGKSTFVKQLKMIHEDTPFQDDELRAFVDVLRNNVVVGMKEIVELVEKFGYDVDEDNRRYARYFRENDVVSINAIEQKDKIDALWADPSVMRAWEESKTQQIQMTHLSYLLQNEVWDRLAAEDYVPTQEDIVRVRQRTTGAYTFRIPIEKYLWEFVDVGGQVPEREKWVRIISEKNVNAIIFFAAMDEYNMMSSEQNGMTKMEISKGVWSSVINDPNYYDKCIILFLNKVDVFTEKFYTKQGYQDFIEKFPIYRKYAPKFIKEARNSNETFASLPKKEQKLKAAIDLIENTFHDVIDYESRDASSPFPRDVDSFPTCAIDSNNIKRVFECAKKNIFIMRMSASGLVGDM